MNRDLLRRMALTVVVFSAMGMNAPCMAQRIVWEAYHRGGDEAYSAKSPKLALQLFGRALEEARQEDSAILIAATATRLGEVFFELGDFSSSEASFRVSLDAFETGHSAAPQRDNTILGKVDVVHVLHGLAGSLQKQEKPKDAEPYLRHAIRIVENRKKPDDVALLKLMNALAHCTYSQGDQVAALALVKQAKLFATTKLDADHHATTETGLLEAAFLSDSGDHDAAAKSALESLDKVEKALGSDHPRVAQTRLFVGKMHHLKGDTDAAKRAVTHARESLKKHYHEDHPIHDLAAQLHDTVGGVAASDKDKPEVDNTPAQSETTPQN